MKLVEVHSVTDTTFHASVTATVIYQKFNTR